MTTTKAGTTEPRSEDEVFAPGGPVVHLALGGIDKPIRQLPARANEVWKQQLARQVGSRLKGFGKLDNADSIAKLFAGVQDVQVELLVAYDADGRLGGEDWILDNATAGEIWQAFKDVIGAAFPFLADAARAPNLVAEILPQLVALLGSSPSTNGAADSVS